MAANAMAACSHPEATRVAIEVLKAGGNAVDAALAASAMLCVVEPHMTGVGGDCFVIYTPAGGKPIALNGSGRSPAAAEAEWYRARGISAIDQNSVHAVTVPGAVDAWCRLSVDYGSKGLDELFAPAIAAAEHGCIVTQRVAFDWARNVERLSIDPDTAALLLPGGRVPSAGDRYANPRLADTLRRIGTYGRAGFYEGPVADDILKKLSALGGLHTAEDFVNQVCEYVEPIRAHYRGHDVYECPPNGQGITALIMLRMLDRMALHEGRSVAEVIHIFSRLTETAYGVRNALVSDPSFSAVDVDDLLSDRQIDALLNDALAGRRARFDETEHKDTVYLAVVDRDGNAISFINSLFVAFGSAIVAPGSGILLQCRGISFSLREGHANVIAPRKRPMNTIMPGMLYRNGRAVMPFGVMGGHYQAAGHAHFLVGILERGFDPQLASEQPRHFSFNGALEVENTFGDDVVRELEKLGHDVRRAPVPIGGAQAVWIDHTRGILIGASDHRKDGFALGY